MTAKKTSTQKFDVLTPVPEEAFEVFKHFTTHYDLEDIKKMLWDLLFHAFASPDADNWDSLERSGYMYLYQELCNLMDVIFEFQLEQEEC